MVITEPLGIRLLNAQRDGAMPSMILQEEHNGYCMNCFKSCRLAWCSKKCKDEWLDKELTRRGY